MLYEVITSEIDAFEIREIALADEPPALRPPAAALLFDSPAERDALSIWLATGGR